MKIKLEDSILLVVDIQERLLPAMNEKEVLLDNCIKLIKGVNALGVPTVVTEQYPKGLGNTVDEVKELLPEAKYFEKTNFSCLGDDVYTYLKESGKNTVLVCGIEAHVCVLQTLIDLVEAGFKTVLITDCVSSRKETDKMYSIIRAGAEDVTISTYESTLFEMTGCAKHPVFKEISKIVK